MKIFEEIRIENTNRCTFKCVMCPRDKLSRRKGIMSFSIFKTITNHIDSILRQESIKWLDLHGFGEPLLDKELSTKVKFISDNYKHINTRLITTGYQLTKEVTTKLLDSGLKKIIFSHYSNDSDHFKKLYGKDVFKEVRKNIEYFIIENNKKNNPVIIDLGNLEVPNHEFNIFTDWHFEMEKLGANIRNSKYVHNWGDAFSFNQKDNLSCSVVNGYRSRVLQITWNGNIIPCAFDFNGEMVLGNILENTIEEIYNSPLYINFIENHKKNTLDNYNICKKCEKCQLL